jgi:hypothetical protein
MLRGCVGTHTRTTFMIMIMSSSCRVLLALCVQRWCLGWWGLGTRLGVCKGWRLLVVQRRFSECPAVAHSEQETHLHEAQHELGCAAASGIVGALASCTRHAIGCCPRLGRLGVKVV